MAVPGDKLEVSIVTMERELDALDSVDVVIAPGTDGQMAILPRHEPLMTTLQPGELVVVRGAERRHYAIGGGFMQVRPHRVVVMADVAERAEEIDLARAEAARRNAERALAEAPTLQDAERALAKLQRARARLKVARRRPYGSPSPTSGQR